MKKKSIYYLLLLSCTILFFFLFTNGSDDSYYYIAPTLSNFTTGLTNPTIYAKIPFSIDAVNNSYDHNSCNKTDTYYSARGLTGKLTITQGSAIIDTSSFILVSKDGDNDRHGIFKDTITMNTAGTYIATAEFYDTEHKATTTALKMMSFDVGLGSEIPLTAGTYQLSSFTALCASNTSSLYTYTNTSSSNNLIINSNGTSASLNINISMGANALAQYPCLKDSSYNYSATGDYSIISENNIKSFKIEYLTNSYVTFAFTFDGTNLILNYGNNGSSYSLKFVKQ